MTNEVFTAKQEEVLKRIKSEDFFICGLHGAKRSGKTFLNNMIFLREIVRVRKIADKLKIETPMYILAGTSSTAIQNNILQELGNVLDISLKFDKHGAFNLCGVKIVQVFTGSVSGLKRARGFTAFGAYVNEASLSNESVFKEIISRCSGEGARIIWDSNPDNPNHWLKRDYIDSKDSMVIDYRFTLDDNTFLSTRYIEAIKAATPAGRFYDRDILGLWTIAEGSVYADFDKDKHIIERAPGNLVRYYAGIDWGFDHYGSIVILGEDSDGVAYIVDGIAESGKHIDWWIHQAKRLSKKYGDIPFYCDTARTEHIYDMKRNGIRAVYSNKAVIPGIEEVAMRWKNDRLFYVRGSIPRFEEEIFQYRWKENSITDDVIKEYDDVLDALRYAIYTQSLIDKKGRQDIDKKLSRAKRLFG